MVALGAALQAVAAPQMTNAPALKSPNPSASVKTEKKSVHLLNPVPQPGAKEKNKIERLGNMSSQPWGAIAEQNSAAAAAAFCGPEMREPKCYVVWIGHEPWR
jgi:hypothetical protein